MSSTEQLLVALDRDQNDLWFVPACDDKVLDLASGQASNLRR
jgi:hypothetical protein